MHRVFPDARIVYIERDAARCIDSNYRRTLNQESLKPSIVMRKYLAPQATRPATATSAPTSTPPAAARCVSRCDRRLGAVLDLRDRMLWLRQTKGPLPFGPKTEGFADIVRRDGPLAYHVEVYRIAKERKRRFEALYGDEPRELPARGAAIRSRRDRAPLRLLRVPVDRSSIDETIRASTRISSTARRDPGPYDEEIHRLMRAQGVT